MKIKYITLTCEKYHSTRVDTIRNTWGKNRDVYFLSDMNLGEDIIGFDYLPKGYDNVWMKYSEFLRTNEDFQHDWYFFTDDDTFVNIQNIQNLLQNYNSQESICIGHVGALHPDGKDMDGNFTGFPLHTIAGSGTELPLIYVSGGAGFILSNVALRDICNYMRHLESFNTPRSYNGDVTFGFWMRNSNIKIIDIKGFWWTNPNELKHDESEIKKSYTYHYIDHNMMYSMNNICNTKIEVKNCIITQSKDQSARLKDWILYHYDQGFDTFVYFDDFSEDDSIQVLEELKKNHNINIIVKFSDGIGNKKSRQEMSNSESYGGDTSINYRIIRSYNTGLNLIKSINPDAVCAFLDVDEFLVSDSEQKVTDIIKEHLDKNNSDLIYIHSFDVKDDYQLSDWYITDINTCKRWSYRSRSNSIFKNRGKSACIAYSIDEILQLPNYVHQLRNLKEGESQIVSYNDYSKLRIHHFRKPNLPDSQIEYTTDYTLINKSKNIKMRYEKI